MMQFMGSDLVISVVGILEFLNVIQYVLLAFLLHFCYTIIFIHLYFVVLYELHALYFIYFMLLIFFRPL